MRIIHLRSSEFFGGPERAILGQCRAMTECRFVCASFVQGHASSDFLNRAKAAGIETATIRERFTGDWKTVAQLRQLINRHRAQLLVCHDYKANFFGEFAVRATSARRLAHFRGETREDVRVRLYNWIHKMMLRRTDLVLTVSNKTAAILSTMGVPENNIRVVFNAIEDEKLVDPGFDRKPPQNRPMQIVAAGRLSHEKGYDVLLEALPKLSSNRAYVLDIYGHGPEQGRLQEQIRRHRLTDRVRLAGFVDDILPVLRQADLMVLPSRSEGMPNILLEAWSQKLGSVCTSVGGVPEMITDGVHGLLAPPADSAALAAQLSRALEHPEEVLAWGAAGYQRVREMYTYRAQARLLTEIYERAVKAK
jgi:glycosyltransferase involved in cell wall biosynthesis